LADAERDRVLSHLVDCATCRAEVEELRAVRDLLHRVGHTSTGPAGSDELSSRLVSIAGPDAFQPVWSRPFRRTRPGVLPSARRAVRIRTAAASLAFGGLLASAAVVGYAAAPPLESRVLEDPHELVRAEFASTVGQLPLASRSLDALMMAPKADELTATEPVRTWTASTTAQLPVTSAAAMALLQRAARNADRVSYVGTQQVTAVSGTQTVSATVQISAQAGRGSSVRLYDRAGREVVNGFMPTTGSRTGSSQLALLPRTYAISGWVGDTVAGRAVTVVEAAVDDSGAASGAVAARWWVDNATGLLLWQETYDLAGAVTLAAGFTALTVTGTPVFRNHLAPRLATSVATASMQLSQADELARRGWSCQDELAGLPLAEVRSDGSDDPEMLHLLYSDGVTTLSVFEQRGRLAGPPPGSHWDESLRAHLKPGTPTLATWQSGDRVFSVATQSSAVLASEAVASLPHADPVGRTTMDRIQAGWARILERVVR
jgi:hypothetical protein